MRNGHVFVVIGVVLLAGCSSFPGDPPTPTETPTATPDGELAPGVTTDGIVNPIALQSAHQQTLLADGFVANVTYENVANDTVQWRTKHHTVAGPGGQRARQRSTAGEPGLVVTDQDSWFNTTHTTVRRLEDNTSAYSVRDRVTAPESLVWPGPVPRRVQDTAQAFEVTAVEQRDWTRFVTLSATIDRSTREMGGTEATLIVDEHGTIHSLEATTNYGGGDDWRVTYVVETVGVVDLAPPAWLADVPPSAALSVSLFTGMGPEGVIQLDHGGADPVPAGTSVTVVGNETISEAQLDEPLEPGETLYVFIAADTGALQLATTEPAAGEYTPVPREFTVRVVTSDGVVLHEERLGWEPRSQP